VYRARWRQDAERVDVTLYAAIAQLIGTALAQLTTHALDRRTMGRR
jgi:hypothetical protein